MTEQTLKKLSRPLILLATIIWGSSFVVLKNTLDTLPVFSILAFRFLAAAVLLALIFRKHLRGLDRGYLIRGLVLGLLLVCAYTAQTYGLYETSPGKNAFLTAAYCVIVPFLNWFISRAKPDKYNIAAALLCVGGIGLVSLSSDRSMNSGDALTLLSSFLYAAHIIAVSRFSKGRDIFLLTILQFAVSGTAALACSFIFGAPTAAIPPQSIISLLYLTTFATAGALLFQNVGQKYTEPAAASVLLSLEAPFGVLFSMLFYSERPTARMLIGFALIFVAVLCSETKLSFLRKKELTEGPAPTIMQYNNKTNDEEKYPARPMQREPWMVGSGSEAAGEWTSEGGSNGEISQ
ncbi:hypothetical protein SDC9_64826 [bioreactor metagenome]|uniref:EamA domain-containing protein n=1 Tax=bioreactor metagenome TaxID=1076179 RepID=A0A644XQL1_9ZZZZ